MLTLWAGLLRAVKDSRLVLLSNPGPYVERAKWFLRECGIQPRRVRFEPRRQDRREYLKLYHQIDISLDTFPYNGHTTSFDSLWMGVPIVTVRGNRAVGRAGASLLANLWLPEWVADTPQQFTTIAAALAHDRQQLSRLRQGMRERMRKSPLMDGVSFTGDLETAYRRMWHQWVGESGKNANPPLRQQEDRNATIPRL